MSTVTIYKKEGQHTKHRVINNATTEYYESYVKITETDGKVQIVKNFNNIIVE